MVNQRKLSDSNHLDLDLNLPFNGSNWIGTQRSVCLESDLCNQRSDYFSKIYIRAFKFWTPKELLELPLTKERHHWVGQVSDWNSPSLWNSTQSTLASNSNMRIKRQTSGCFGLSVRSPDSGLMIHKHLNGFIASDAPVIPTTSLLKESWIKHNSMHPRLLLGLADLQPNVQ